MSASPPTPAQPHEVVGWRPNTSHPKLSPDEAISELARIKRTRGALTPTHIVDESRAPTSPFHNWFEWDDSTAAEEHRRHQARQIVRSLVIRREHGDGGDHVTQSPRFVSVVTDSERPEYLETEKALGNKNLARQVVNNALRDLRAWQQRYRGIVEMADILKAVENFVQSAIPVEEAIVLDDDEQKEQVN